MLRKLSIVAITVVGLTFPASPTEAQPAETAEIEVETRNHSV